MTRLCPADGAVLDGGPVVFWCPACRRDVHGSCAAPLEVCAPQGRVTGRIPVAPEAGPARHARERAAGRGHAPSPGRAPAVRGGA